MILFGSRILHKEGQQMQDIGIAFVGKDVVADDTDDPVQGEIYHQQQTAARGLYWHHREILTPTKLL
jgi:hypothetical protein